MQVLSIEEIDSVSGGMRLDDAHGIWVQDQTLSGYQAEYGSVTGSAYWAADQVRMEFGYEAQNVPPAHYVA
ncbi:MAG: hypothetical protein ABIO86_10505 [Sphingomonas sp.]